jgi:hypothetical protein
MIFARGFARRCAAYLALAALMLQLALSCEHVHKHDVAFSGLGLASHSRQELEAFGIREVGHRGENNSIRVGEASPSR